MAKHIINGGHSIKEAMRLYNLSVDTLYYYEKMGVINPARNPSNGYRIFRAEDFFALNVITELRAMGFEFEQIRSYLSERTFSSTMQTMNSGLSKINEQLAYLNSIKDGVVESLQRYAHAAASASDARISIEHVPARPCLLAADVEILYEDLPYLFARCAHSHATQLHALHSTTYYVIDPDAPLTAEGVFAPKAMLLHTDALSCEADAEIPAGLYARCTFAGSMLRAPEVYERMMAYVHEQGYQKCGDPVESSLVGEYESSNLDEFVSRLEIPVKPS